MSWAYFLEYKSETFESFQKFKALVGKQSGGCIKTLHIDRGGEFLSNEFNVFYEDNDICKELTSSYTLEQNSIAE